MSKKSVVSEILKQKRYSSKNYDVPVKRTSICLPESLYKSLKTYAAVEGKKLNEIMIEILEAGIKKRLAQKDIKKELESL